MSRQQGTITSFDNSSGWIALVSGATGGSPVFVHANDVMGPMPPTGVIRTLEPGDFVELDLVLGDRGWYAARVTLRGDLNLPDRPLP